MFPDCWSYRTLGEIVVKNGLQIGPFGSQLKASEYVETLEGIPVVMPKDMLNGRIITNSIARVNPVKAKQLKRHHLKAGDIIFGRRGEIGRCALVTEEEEGWLCGSGCLRARLSNEVYPEFFAYQMQLSSTAKWLESNAVGQTMLNLNTAILSCTPVIIPPIAEQKKIAEVLGIWDSAIALTEKLITAKQKLRNTLQNKLFLLQETSCKKLSQIANVKSGSTPLRSKYKEYFEYGTIPWVKTMDLNNCFIYKTDELITQKAIDETSCSIFPKETVLVAMYGGFNQIGRTGLLRVDAAVNQAISAIQVNQAVIIPEYLLQYLNAKVGYWQRFAASSRKDPNITRKDVCDFPIQIPSILEQKKIVDVLKTSDYEIEILRKYHSTLRTQKRGLMQKLLTGEWRVKIEETATQLTEVKE